MSRPLLTAPLFPALLILVGCAPTTTSRPSFAPSSSGASVSIVGISRARECFDAASARRPSKALLAACDTALAEVMIDQRTRAACYVNRGIIHMQLENLEAALADFDAAIQTRPKTPEAWINKGIAHIRQGDDKTAAPLLSHGLDLKPENPAVAYYSRAWAYEGLGRLREAYEDYGRAAALAPDWPDPYEQLRRFKITRVKTAGA